jgi:hypothetical protein
LLALVFALGWTAWAAPPRPELQIVPTSPVYGQPFSLYAYATTVLAGSYTFAIDGATIGVVAAVSSPTGFAEFDVTTAAIVANLMNPIYLVGTHTATAAYSGDPNIGPFTYSLNFTIVGQPTTSQITNLDQTIYYGQEIGYDYGVDAQLGAEPTDAAESYGTLDGGSLDAYIGTKLACATVYGIGGRCADAPFEGYSVGTYETYVVYGGNQYYAPSTSPQYAVTVIPDYTATGVTSSANPSVVLQPVVFSATVSAYYQPVDPTTTTPTPVGMVQFFDGTTPIGTAMVNAQGTATVSDVLLVGTHSITACYQVSLNFRASCSPVLTQVVTLATVPENTVTLLTSSVNPSVVGQSVTFSVAVETTGAIIQVPGGAVNLYDGGTLLGPLTLDATGRAAFSTAALAAGVHAITAVYAGGATTAASTSAVLQQVVLVALPPANGFLLVVDPTTISVGVGNSVTVNVAVVGVNPSGQPFTLGCTRLPNEATCAFGQTTLPAHGGSTTLTITTAAPHACGTTTPYFVASGKVRGLPWLAVAGIGLLLARRRRRGLMLAVVMVCAVGAGLMPVAGCGGCTDFGTQPFTYGLGVTATEQGAAAGTAYATETQAVQMRVHL